ncbi:phage portal protein [Paracoccus litorisediminis]|uniref:phage portal protein n=1 Tax=Paracoccus litorisediminis TaxID=2006130 RepID=UPI003730DF13
MKLLTTAMALFGLKRETPFFVDERYQDTAGAGGELVTPLSALSLSAVWACANLVAGTMASLPFEVYRRQPDGHSAVDAAHPLHGVIYDSPNYDQTALDFWEYIALSVELWGNGYVRVERAGNRVVSLHPIHPEAMTVKRITSGSLEYSWTEDGKHFRRADRSVLHVRGPGGNPVGGMSTLQFGRQVFSAAIAADRAAASMFRNGLRPSAIIKFKEWLSPAQRDVAERALVEKYMGAMNAGRPMIAEGGMEYQQLTISPEDAQMLETRQFSVEEICRFFQVPPALIGHAGASTAWPTSVEQQIIMFLTFYLRKRLKRIEQAVRKQLLTPEDRAAGVSTRFNMEGLLRGDSAARATFYQTMTQIGAMTINEVRQRENLPSVVGGETPRMQSQNIPITQTNTQEQGNADA